MADASASASFTAPKVNASPCNFSLTLPKFTFGFVLPAFSFPPPIPFPRLRLKLSCDLSNPVDISADFGPGGGRKSNADPSPDADDSF